eukprot:16142709-Heterocapsa_arctica.AAC.1
MRVDRSRTSLKPGPQSSEARNDVGLCWHDTGLLAVHSGDSSRPLRGRKESPLYWRRSRSSNPCEGDVPRA